MVSPAFSTPFIKSGSSFKRVSSRTCSLRSSFNTSFSTKCKPVRVAVRMNADEQNSDTTKNLTPTELESEEPKYSFWGVASFGIILAIFMLGILATLYRDFVPGGLVGPAETGL